MRPFSLGVTTLVQGFYVLLWVVVLFDVASPTFDLGSVPHWNAVQTVVAFAVAFMASAALGVVMHTLSKRLSHRFKLAWELDVLASETIQIRMRAMETTEVFPEGPEYAELLISDDHGRVHKAAAFMNDLEFHVIARGIDVYRTIQV